MNELTKIFNYKGSQLRTVIKSGMIKCFYLNGQKIDRFDLLATAARLAHQDETAAWEIMNLASKLFHVQGDVTFNALYGAVALEITWASAENESNIHVLFNKHARKLLGENAEIIKKHCHPKHQPDSWVRMNGEDVPVEMKLGSFDKKALLQLQRYIKHYGTSTGIAVGRNLAVSLPDNIIFMSIERLEDIANERINQNHKPR